MVGSYGPDDERYSPNNIDNKTNLTHDTTPEDDVVVDDGFSYDGFVLVHREFFAHLREPAITFNRGKIALNSACIRKLPKVDYVQVLVNSARKMLVVRPCDEEEIYSFQWCNEKAGKRAPRAVMARLFHMKICDLMSWNPEFRYKILGKLVRSNGQYLFAFDLTAHETYKRVTTEDGKSKSSRNPVFPAEWKNQFGVPYEEHQKALQINLFDGYAIYGLTDTNNGIQQVDIKPQNPPVLGAPDDLHHGGDSQW